MCEIDATYSDVTIFAKKQLIVLIVDEKWSDQVCNAYNATTLDFHQQKVKINTKLPSLTLPCRINMQHHNSTYYLGELLIVDLVYKTLLLKHAGTTLGFLY